MAVCRLLSLYWTDVSEMHVFEGEQVEERLAPHDVLVCDVGGEEDHKDLPAFVQPGKGG